ncbi:MAG: UDP-3-O-(3-hydroxymyristoyl)glucosamine N-acyltransferase [Flavobacteriales bacterium]|nr:UDP-3-O-(3-hydroxymyristoyl)glucosamine N-acyltransferase [Flavobacteriales bacterium]
MKLPRPHTLKEIAGLAGCQYVGKEDHQITGINEIHVVEEGDIVFVDHPKYYEKALNSAATTILIDKEVVPPTGKALLIHEKPFDIFNTLTRHFIPAQDWEESQPSIGSTARIAPGVIIGKGVSIGENSIIHPNVVIYDNTEIGDNVEVHANTVIGGHGFYYKKDGGYKKMHSAGRVILENDVEIGSGCTIDKGVTGATTIGAGTKIDNLVHIGHDTVIGKRCLIAAQVGIAGCVRIEDDVTLWGQVGVRSDILIGQNAVVLAQTGISKSIEGGRTYFGSPVAESREKLKELANTRKIPYILEELKKLKLDRKA